MLKGQAKTDYQREYMRRKRGSNTAGLTRSNINGVVYREESSSKIETQGEEITVTTQERIPIYQQGRSYAPGSKVRYQGRVITVPELDADGYIVSE